MSDRRQGKVVTFYSFKGGTGRSMALANTAWILAANGHRVLVVDWDLESPGLHRFFKPFIDPRALRDTPGLINLIQQFEDQALRAGDPELLPYEQLAQVHPYCFAIDWAFPAGGTLNFLSAGWHNSSFGQSIASMNWDDFYERLNGGKFFNHVRDDMRANYDFTLIDSRTGYSDVADICTLHMPDILVDCFTLSDQGIEGAADVARRIGGKPGAKIRILPVAMRIDPAEKGKADAGRSFAKQRFSGLPADMGDDQRDDYWRRVQVPYLAFYAYEETLATFGDEPGVPGTLLSAFEELTSVIAQSELRLPAMDEAVRKRSLALFERSAVTPEVSLTLRYPPSEAAWGEWIAALLEEAGVAVNDPASDHSVPVTTSRNVLIVSSAEHLIDVRRASGDPVPLIIDVARPTPLVDVAEQSVWIGESSEAEAIERIARLVGRPEPVAEAVDRLPRFPGAEPAVFQVPPRNTRFTGRESDLSSLREHLRSQASPVALHGLGGVGKTQIAVEYAHRFRSAYDAVWWIDADSPADADSSLSDLGQRGGLRKQQNEADGAAAVRQALRLGSPWHRWLVIFDNAEDPAQLRDRLPDGPGHVLITTQDNTWGSTAQLFTVNGFTRPQSLAYLRQRVTHMSEYEADRIAALLGDLPIAIVAAAALLEESGSPIADYIQAIETGDLGPLAVESEEGRRVEATWDLSLQRLESRSKAAYRLLQLCAFMAPEININLVYTDALAIRLSGVDPAIGKGGLGPLVRNLARLALAQIEQRSESRTSDPRDHSQGRYLVVHRLLRHVLRSRMSPHEQEVAQRDVHALIADAGHSLHDVVDDDDTWPRYRILWPHLETSNAEASDDPDVQELLVDRVRYYYLRGNPVRALEVGVRAEQQWQTQLENASEPESGTGDEARQLRRRLLLLRLRFNIANARRDLGQFGEALALDTATLAEQRELLHGDHAHVLMTAGSLAADLRSLGRYREALARDEETYAAWVEHHGPDEAGTINALSNLAVSHRLMGHLDEALQLSRKAYDTRATGLGNNDPRTLLTAASVGRDMREAGDYKGSVEFLRRVLDHYVQEEGEASRFAVNARVNLAVSLRTAGDPQAAERYLEAAFRDLGGLVGDGHPETLACQLSLAVTYLERLRLQEATYELEMVRRAHTERLGEDHPHTLVCVNNLAATRRAQGEMGEARELAKYAADELGRVLGTSHPYALAATMNYGVVLADDGENATALVIMQKATDGLVATLGDQHPHTLRCRANEALIRRRLGQDPDSVGVTMAIEALGVRIGAQHPAVDALREGEGRLLRRIIDPHPF